MRGAARWVCGGTCLGQRPGATVAALHVCTQIRTHEGGATRRAVPRVGPCAQGTQGLGGQLTPQNLRSPISGDFLGNGAVCRLSAYPTRHSAALSVGVRSRCGSVGMAPPSRQSQRVCAGANAESCENRAAMCSATCTSICMLGAVTSGRGCLPARILLPRRQTRSRVCVIEVCEFRPVSPNWAGCPAVATCLLRT